MDESLITAPPGASEVEVPVAAALRRRAAAIVADWRQRLGVASLGATPAQPRLAGHVPELLELLAVHLEEEAPGDFQGPALSALADPLGDEEVLAEVLREYSVLRRCVSDALLGMGAPLPAAVLARAHQAIDAAVTGAVGLHMAARHRRDAQLETLLTARTGPGGMATLLRVLLGTTASIDSAVVYLLEGEALVRHAAVGLEGVPARTWRVGEGLVGRVAASREEVLCVAPGPTEAEAPEGTRAAVAAPVVLDSVLTVGVVQMASRTAPGFLSYERRLLEALARRVATEVGAMRLRELQGRYARERHLEEDLAQSEERFRTVFEHAAIGIVVADVRGRMLRTNRALQELAGYTEAELRQLTIADVTPPEDLTRERQLFQELLEGRRGPYRVERRYLRKDGSVGWCRLTVSLGRSGQGKPPFIIGMVEDLTERRRVEELERTGEFRERFLGVLGHDLRTPLNSILLSAYQLQQRRPGDVLATARRIQRSAERMSRMIADLLDVARSRLGGGLPVSRAPMDLGEAARAAVEEMASAHPGRRIRCEVSGSVEGWWDPDRVAQVLTNLLGNALQYSPPDSEVRVEVRGSTAWAELTVHNAGAPIPSELLPELFEPFRRAAQQDSRSDNLGLGLFIVAQVVRAHGGDLSVRSTAAEGTTFTVRLPRAGEPPDAEAG